MPKKCESCRHCVSEQIDNTPLVFIRGKQIEQRSRLTHTIIYCANDKCATDQVREMFPDRKGVPLDMARQICDREGDGIFVYFEPKTPAAGAFVQITGPDYTTSDGTPRKTLKAAA